MVPLITLKILFPFMAPVSMCIVMVGVGLSEAARIPSSESKIKIPEAWLLPGHLSMVSRWLPSLCVLL